MSSRSSFKSKIVETAKAIKNGVVGTSKNAFNATERVNDTLGNVSDFMSTIHDVAPAAIAITAVAATAVAAPPIAVLIASIAIIAKKVKDTYDLNEDLKNLIGEAHEMANTALKIVIIDDKRFRNIYTHIMNLFVTCNYLDLRYTKLSRGGFVFFPQDYLDEITQQLTLLNSAILVIIIKNPDILKGARPLEKSEESENDTEAKKANHEIQTILSPLFEQGNDNVTVFQNMSLTPESFEDIKSSAENSEKLSSKPVWQTTFSPFYPQAKGGWTKRNRRTKYRKPRKIRKTKKPIFLIQKRKTRRATKSTKINIKKR